MFVQLNKNTTRLANFSFEIGSTLSIGFVDLKTLLKQIVFYIVPINIPFLLYLIDIDKHGAFF